MVKRVYKYHLTLFLQKYLPKNNQQSFRIVVLQLRFRSKCEFDSYKLYMIIILISLIIIMTIVILSIKTHLSSVLLTRITAIILFYSGVLAFNALYIQPIGSGIGVYSVLFQVSSIGGLLLIPKNSLIILSDIFNKI